MIKSFGDIDIKARKTVLEHYLILCFFSLQNYLLFIDDFLVKLSLKVTKKATGLTDLMAKL